MLALMNVRTFDLFKRTKVPLIDYYLDGENTPKRYNGFTVYPPKDGATIEEDPFHVSQSKGGSVPDEYIYSSKPLTSTLASTYMVPSNSSFSLTEWTGR